MDGRVARVGLIALLLLAAAACGGDDGGDGGVVGSEDAVEPGEDGENGGDDGAGGDVDVCSLLDASDVEAEFGDRGAVTERPEGCGWEVGDFPRSGAGSVSIVNLRLPGGSSEDDYDISRDVADHPVDVEDVGDEAFFDLMDPISEFTSGDSSAGVTFRTGDQVLLVQSHFINLEVDPDQERDRLVALAQRMVDRL